jgi:hypothetical protein
MWRSTDRLPRTRRTARAVALGLALQALAGCATARFYPVCVIDTGYEMPEQLWAQRTPVVLRLVDQVTRSRYGSPLVTSGGASILATEAEHRSLERLWPQFACVASACSGIVGDELVKQCRASVESYLLIEPPDRRGWPPDDKLRCARIEASCSVAQ